MSRIVIALGGNALGNNPEEQQEKIENAAPSLIGLIKQGNEIIISHGNGPQVGMINLTFAQAAETDEKAVKMPLAECTAMSQGYIGYHLQKGMRKEIRKEGKKWYTATVVTQVEVDRHDAAFDHPTKPIGAYYDAETASKFMRDDPALTFMEDSGRGWRRVVPSPKPIGIIEKESILHLLDNDFIVIACGGGGIPVVRDEKGDLHGVDAVIDKDFASAKLAELVGAEYLFILTAVDRVSINFGKPDEKQLEHLTVAEAEKLCDEKQFGEGSMLPKVQAAISFAKSGKGRKAVIASLEKAPLAIRGETGTIISDD